MQGWILYKRAFELLTSEDYGVSRFLEEATLLGITLTVIDPERLVMITVENGYCFEIDGCPLSLPDFVLPRMGAETTMTAFTLLKQLEYQGVWICNTVNAIRHVKDKMWMSQCLHAAGFPSPKTLWVTASLSCESVAAHMAFPVVLKAVSSGKGKGVFLCQSRHELRDILSLIAPLLKTEGFIVQEFVAESYGCDLRVLVLGDRILGSMKRTAREGFKANYALGGSVSTYALTPAMETLALKTAQLFQLTFAGIDFLFQGDRLIVCEANSSPGFKGMEDITHMNIAFEVLNYIQTQVQQKRQVA